MSLTPTTEAGHRGNMSFRGWDGSFKDLKRAAETVSTPPSTLVGDAMEVLLGYVRCSRCTMPIPVEFGDCTGADMIEVIAEAVRQAHAQKCWAFEGVERVRRPAHRPVLVAAPPDAEDRPAPALAARPAPKGGRQAAERILEQRGARVKRQRAEDAPPAPVVFLEPGGSPVIAAAVPDREKGAES